MSDKLAKTDDGAMKDNNTASDLVQQGLTAARVGDQEDARRLLTEATTLEPDNVDAWLALAGVVEMLTEKQRCFSTALKLAPNNQEAQSGLALVEKKLAEKVEEHNHEALEDNGSETGVGFCKRHPDTETALRCNRCNTLICPKCAQRTPVGFRCPDCIREQEDKFYSGGNTDYIIAAVITLPLSFIAAWLFTAIFGRFFIFFLIFIGGAIVAGVTGFIAEIVRRGVGKRRSRYLGHVAAGSLIVATLPFVLLSLFNGSLFGLIAPGLFLFLGATTIFARLR